MPRDLTVPMFWLVADGVAARVVSHSVPSASRWIRPQSAGSPVSAQVLIDVVRREAGDRLVDLDVEVVDRDREAGDRLRRPHESDGPRVRLLDVQQRVPATEAVVLAGRVLRGCGRTAPRSHRSSAHCSGVADGVGARADVLAAAQAQALRCEQLLHVRRADGAVEAAAEPEAVDGRPGQERLVAAVVLGRPGRWPCSWRSGSPAPGSGRGTPILSWTSGTRSSAKPSLRLVAPVDGVRGTALAPAPRPLARDEVGLDEQALLPDLATDRELDRPSVADGSLTPAPRSPLTSAREHLRLGPGIVHVGARAGSRAPPGSLRRSRRCSRERSPRCRSGTATCSGRPACPTTSRAFCEPSDELKSLT